MTFINGIRTGRITVHKVDTQRNPLSGAAFLLEWSEDGALWWPVTFSETAIKGGCANAELVDGMLTSGEDGILEWTNLHPGLQYRLTEVKAPDGYKLLPDVAFSGELPADDLTVELTVVNARTFTMPEAGAASGTILKVLSLLAALGCLGLLLARKRRP